MDRNYYRKTSITHEPEKYHYQQNSQSVPYSPVKVSQQQMNRGDKFEQTALNNKARNQKGSSQAQGQGYPTHKKVYSNRNNRESEDWGYYEKNTRNLNQRNELPKSPQKPYIQRHEGGFQNDDHFAVNFESNRFGNNYQEELEIHYMEPTKEQNSKRAPVQNKANEGRYSSMSRLLEIRKREFDNDEYVYEGVGEYGSNQRQNQREQSDDEGWYQGRNQAYSSNYDDEEGLTYENIVQTNAAASSYRSSNLKSHPDQNRHFPANPTYQGVLSNAASKKKLDLITLRSDYPDVPPVFQPGNQNYYDNNNENEPDEYNDYDDEEDQAPKKSYAQIHSDRIKNAKLAAVAKQSFEIENKYMVKASPYDNQPKKKGEGWHTERDVTFENSYAVKEYPPTVPRKNRWEKLDMTQTKEKSQPKKSERNQHENVSPPPQSNYWPMSSPFKKKQLQENTSKYLNTAQQQSPPPPSSAKKSVKKQNMWVEEPDSQSFHSSSQEAPNQFGILKSPPKRSVSTANLADNNSQELTRSKNFASSKNYPLSNHDSYSPVGPRNTTQGGASDSITISSQPSYNVSYVPTAATTPNSHVQLQLQLPIALNPAMQPNFQNMPPPPQFINPGYIYPNNFQVHPQNQPIAMNYPFTPNNPFYLNPQIYQNTPQMIFPNIPQPVYNNINPQPTASNNNSFVYFSNYASIQDQQNTQSNLTNMKLSQVIPSHQNLPRSEKNLSESTEDSQRKTLDKSIKNYIKDQEELLKKLDEDKKKLVERLKNPVVEQPQQHSVPTKREFVEEPPVRPEATPSKQKKSSEKLKTSPKTTIKTPAKAFSNEEAKKAAPIQKEQTASIPGTPKSKTPETSKKERVSAWEAPAKQKSHKKEKKPLAPAAELSLMDENVAKVRSASPQSPNFKIPSPKAPASIQQVVEPEKEQVGAWKMDFAVVSEKEKAPIEEGAFSNKKPTTLAEMFLKNKRDLAEKLDHQKDHSKPLDKENKPARTKEEILKQRKAMMEYKGPARAKSQIEGKDELRKEDLSPAPMGRGFGSSQNPFVDPAKVVKEPNPELLNRLAFGTRAKVTKEEMKALNSKNYELLPEVRKKKEEEKKKEEMRKRLEKAKELDEKIRGTMRRKTIKPFE